MASQKTSVAGRLLAALAKVDRPGTFCASGTAPAVLPGLEVKGLGAVGVPLTAEQAKRLKRRCEQAAYGKGEQTLVDTDVRRVWRMTPDKFSLTNPAWAGVLETIVGKVQEELGLEGRQLQPHLYDLLLYEKGSFFLPHRDGEKLDGMVATLVVVLPSAYEGGELIVRHEGDERVIDLTAGEDARFQTRYAAFYADCEHEVRPLRSGYRLCLVYNLTLARSAAKLTATSKPPSTAKSKAGKASKAKAATAASGKAIGAPRNREHVEAVADVLHDWAADEAGPDKLAVTLEHKYTQDGLAWDALKGVDAARARVLTEAAQRTGSHAYLALLTFWESGSAEYSEGRAPRRGWGRRSYYYDEDDEDAENYVMGENFDSSLTAEHWRSPDGRRPAFGPLPVEANEVVPEESLTAVEPETSVSGYTGNEGLTMDRWYRHAAVVVWPDARHFDVLCSAGARQAVPALARMVSAWRRARAGDAAALKERCLTFAATILAHWPTNDYRGRRRAGTDDEAEKGDPSDPMPSLLRLGDPKLIGTYLRDVLVRDVTLDPGKGTVPAIARHGWATFRPDLVALFEATGGETIERNVGLLDRLCRAAARGDAKDGTNGKGKPAGKAAANQEARETCRRVAEAAVAALAKIDAPGARDDWRARDINRAAMLAHLVRALLAVGFDDLLERVIAHAAGLPKRYPLRDVQLKALRKLDGWLREKLKRPSPALAQWLAACRKELESLTAAAPQPPADFRREAAVACKCADCKELNRFLRDPTEQQHGFQMAQERRKHLGSNIQSYRCDLTCTTDRRPRPQILVCTKNTASHDRRVKEYEENLDHLAAVKSLQAALPG